MLPIAYDRRSAQGRANVHKAFIRRSHVMRMTGAGFWKKNK